MAGLDAATGKRLWLKYTIPGPGEAGHETWKGNTNAWQTGGGAVWVTGTYDPATNQTIWGTGNPVPMFDPFIARRQPLHQQRDLLGPRHRQHELVFPVHARRHVGLRRGRHPSLSTARSRVSSALLTHSARNGFLYTMERGNGAMVMAKPYMEVNWTKGIDQKTGKPVDYDPNKDIQTYAGIGNLNPGDPLKKVCPSHAGGNNYWPSSFSPKTKLLYIPALSNCVTVTIDREKHNKERGWNGGLSQTADRWESNLTAADPITGDIKKSVHLPYPNYSGTLATGGGLVFLALLDGTVAAYDDTTLDELWKINVGSGFSAPPMTFEVNGKQYVAIVSGPSPGSRGRLINTPELKEQRHALVLYVFAL
jgi:alcohol dehydrogenase (cytochrome c)